MDDFRGRTRGAMTFAGSKDSFAEIRSPEKYFCFPYRYIYYDLVINIIRNISPDDN